MEKQKQTRGFTRVQDVVNAITGLMRDAGAEGDMHRRSPNIGRIRKLIRFEPKRSTISKP